MDTKRDRDLAHALLMERSTLTRREAGLVLLGIASAGGSLDAAAVAARALLAAARETDGAKRRASLEQAERVLLADQPLIPIYFYVNKHLVNPQVRGWYDNVMNVVYSRELELAPAGAQGKGAGP